MLELRYRLIAAPSYAPRFRARLILLCYALFTMADKSRSTVGRHEQVKEKAATVIADFLGRRSDKSAHVNTALRCLTQLLFWVPRCLD